MNIYRADMHIHTILSPCGSLEMSPVNIVKTALQRGLNMIGITDHNSTRQCETVVKVAMNEDLTVICGVEVNTREEIHCLALFPSLAVLSQFQRWLDHKMPDIPNHPDKFGDQMWVDTNQMIAGEEPRLLIAALDAGLEETEKMVHSLGGLFIAAHADKSRNSIISQLGFIPDDVVFDAIELSPNTSKQVFLNQHPHLADYAFITSSDAHYLHQVGMTYTTFQMASGGFHSLAECLRKNIGISMCQPYKQ